MSYAQYTYENNGRSVIVTHIPARWICCDDGSVEVRCTPAVEAHVQALVDEALRSLDRGEAISVAFEVKLNQRQAPHAEAA